MLRLKELKEIKRLLDEAAYSPTKAGAKSPLAKLNGIANKLPVGYVKNKLKSTISYAEQASGRVSNKEHWIGCMEQDFCVFESESETE